MSGHTVAPGEAAQERPRPGFLTQVGGLLRATHPAQLLTTMVVLASIAAASGRPPREVLAVAATVLVGQSILGWDNDLVDRGRDARHRRDKPLATGRVEPGNASFAIAVGVLLVIPLSVWHGLPAAAAYLGALVVGAAANRWLRATPASPLPWLVSGGLHATFLSYGGWDGATGGGAPSPLVVGLCAAMGLAAHLLAEFPGLIADREDRYRSVPVLLARRVGAPALVAIGAVVGIALWVTIIIVAHGPGLESATLG